MPPHPTRQRGTRSTLVPHRVQELAVATTGLRGVVIRVAGELAHDPASVADLVQCLADPAEVEADRALTHRHELAARPILHVHVPDARPVLDDLRDRVLA